MPSAPIPQANALIASLKKALKSQGLTYRDVAAHLELSEASVKRMFSEENLSLRRLDAICQLAGLEISDLARRMEAETRRVLELSEEQERELVSDNKLLLVAFLVVNAWTFEQIRTHYNFSENGLVQYLARLDRLKFIELLPGNRIRRLISPQFGWRRNGPIQAFFNRFLRDDYLDSEFAAPGESFGFVSGMLSPESNRLMMDKLAQLAAEFNQLNRRDQQLELSARQGCSMILALRPWQPKAFAECLCDEAGD